MTREAWTDERMDDLNAKVDRLGQRMETGFTDTREEVRASRTEFREELRGEIGGVRGEMREIRAELGALNRTIHQFLFAIVGTIFLGFMGTISALISLT